MTSPLERRLLTKIEQCVDPEGRACYVADLACYWARIGEFEKAEELRSELRRSFGDGRSAKVSILIMCIEALIGYFRTLSPSARDRMARAHILSVAMKDRHLVAMTSAWMSHIDFNLNCFQSMASSVSTCLSSIEPDDEAVKCRICLVLGDAFLFADARGPSTTWYARARSAAEKTGDQAAIGALTYNRAALHVAAARLRHVSHEMSASDINTLRTEVESAISYQAIAQLKSLDHLLQTAKIGILMIQNRPRDALPLIVNLLESKDVPDGSAQRALLQADRALVLAQLGQNSAAVAEIDLIEKAKVDSFGPDDRLLIWASTLEASKICCTSVSIEHYKQETARAQVEHGRIIAELRSLLRPFESALAFNL